MRLCRSVHACTGVCRFIYACGRICVDAKGQGQVQFVRSIHLVYWDRFSLWGSLGRLAQEPACLHLPRAGIASLHHPVCLFVCLFLWMMGIKFRSLCCAGHTTDWTVSLDHKSIHSRTDLHQLYLHKESGFPFLWGLHLPAMVPITLPGSLFA